MPGVNDIPKVFGSMSYLAGALVLGAAGAFVAVVWSPPPPPWLQPVNKMVAPSPISTIRVISLFIVGVTFTKKAKRTSKKLILFYWGLFPGCSSFFLISINNIAYTVSWPPVEH